MRFTTKVLATLLLTTGLIGGSMFGLNGTPTAKVNAAPIPAAKDDGKIELEGSAYELLRFRKVLKDLKCSAEQRVQIEDAFEELDEKRPAHGFTVQINPGNANNPQAIQQQIEAQKEKAAATAQAEAKEIAVKHLRKEQLVRLGQIDLQSRGVKAFADAKVAGALKLTDDQKKIIRDATEDLNIVPVQLAVPGVPGGLPGAPAGVVVQGFAVGTAAFHDPKKQAQAVEKVVSSFDKDQQQTWKNMIGDKIGFDLPPRGNFHGGNVRIVAGAAGVIELPATQPAPVPAPAPTPRVK